MFGSVLFSFGLIRLLDFPIYSVITVNTVFSVVKVLFRSLCSSLFCKRYVLIRLLYLSPVSLFWVCWVRGNFSGGPGHIFSVCVCLRCVYCRAGTILFVHFLERMAGLYRFFLFSGSVVAGTVSLK